MSCSALQNSWEASSTSGGSVATTATSALSIPASFYAQPPSGSAGIAIPATTPTLIIPASTPLTWNKVAGTTTAYVFVSAGFVQSVAPTAGVITIYSFANATTATAFASSADILVPATPAFNTSVSMLGVLDISNATTYPVGQPIVIPIKAVAGTTATLSTGVVSAVVWVQ